MKYLSGTGAATMGGEPVQILRVKDGHDVELNKGALDTILLGNRVKDKPVVGISVAGAYRQGKSFLLRFLLRYLRSNGRSNWMEDTDTPLDGFKWRPGSTRETTGILLWSEVFLMTNSKGEEVAVLLMDTQGTFDCESTMKESTTIFSLSVMTSSVQVYNLMNNLKEDDLQHLQFFAEYGRLAQKETERRPFQKLLFLVLDWNWPYEREFGYGGGRSLIESRLEIKDGQDAELRMLRESITSCFSEIDCFLMPHPGAKATANASNAAATDKARQYYMSGMAKRPRRNLDKLRDFHKDLLVEVKKVFDEFPKMGGDEMSSICLDALTKELEEYCGHVFEEEEELIKKEQEEEARREREREEDRRREEERERERVLERERAAAREAEIAEEREQTGQRVAHLESRLKELQDNQIGNLIQGALFIAAAALSNAFPGVGVVFGGVSSGVRGALRR